jgi:PAS domain S-box-containing protein
MFGYESDDQIVGRPFTDFVSPDYRELMVQRGQARNEGRDVPDHYEFKALRRDGSELDAEISVSTIVYRAKQARLGVIKDITERKQAERALRDSEERFRRLSEATLEAIIIHDHGLILDANEQAAAIHGYELSEFIGMDLLAFIAPESHELVRQRMLSGYGEPYEVWGLRKDGTTFPMEVCGKNISYEGRQVRVGVARDISERKRAEEAAQAAREELESRAENAMRRGNAFGLTFRELTVLYLMAAGRADKEIGFQLGISSRTASKHVENILQKMGVGSRTEASVRALREGLAGDAQ